MMSWIVSFVLARISLDRLIAIGLSWLIDNFFKSGRSAEYYNQSKQILAKVNESIKLTEAILADDKVEESEIADARVALLKIWAKGGDDIKLKSMLINNKIGRK